mgnify:CR=1 FL=1
MDEEGQRIKAEILVDAIHAVINDTLDEQVPDSSVADFEDQFRGKIVTAQEWNMFLRDHDAYINDQFYKRTGILHSDLATRLEL